MPISFQLLYVAVFGSVIGSFLNVVIHRLPRGTSVVWPRSACTFCGAPIRAFDNFPVLSWLVLRGKCRRCSAPISIRYPLVELVTAGLFVACLLRFGPTWQGAVAAGFTSFILVLAMIDFDHFLLPDKLTIPGIAAGLALQPVHRFAPLLDCILGVVIGAGVLILLINAWYWIREEEGMGLGDVNMLAMVGAFLGWQGALITLTIGTVSGAVVGISLVLLADRGAGTRLPFGVFLAIGALIALFFGTTLTDLYLSLL